MSALPKHPEAIVIDQSPIGKSSRANAATYIGVFDLIRKVFASATGAEPSLFSFNSTGACPKCNGQEWSVMNCIFWIQLRLHVMNVKESGIMPMCFS